MNTVLIGLSGFHKVVLFVFKTIFPKSKPKEIELTNFRVSFSEENFNQELRTNLTKD